MEYFRDLTEVLSIKKKSLLLYDRINITLYITTPETLDLVSSYFIKFNKKVKNVIHLMKP